MKYSRQIIWFMAVTLLGFMANTGADLFLQSGFKVNNSMKCSVVSKETRPLDFNMEFHLEDSSVVTGSRAMFINAGYKQDIEAKVYCHWENQFYICKSDDYNYIELDTEKVWKSQISGDGKSNVEVEGLWHRRSLSQSSTIRCVQEVIDAPEEQ